MLPLHYGHIEAHCYGLPYRRDLLNECCSTFQGMISVLRCERLVPPEGIEPSPVDFQSTVRTSYTRAACVSLYMIVVFGSTGMSGGIRTHTEEVLSLLTLPIGLHSHYLVGRRGNAPLPLPCQSSVLLFN